MAQVTDTNIGFIGGGNMAQAIIRGLLAAGHPASRIAVADPEPAQRDALLAHAPGIEVTADNTALAGKCDVLVLAVKPQVMAKVVTPLAAVARPRRQVVLSVAAGITLRALRGWLGDSTILVRVMPNTPALAGAGMAGLYADPATDATARELAAYVMGATGKTLWVDDEGMMDAVTALSGSGPAYFFRIMEIMQEVAEELGFSAADARLLATQTAAGAGILAAASAEDPGELRTRVTSPGGTTAAALAALEAGGIRDIFRTALLAARDRSIELGQHEE